MQNTLTITVQDVSSTNEHISMRLEPAVMHEGSQLTICQGGVISGERGREMGKGM
jgi:hypothetical protein